MQRVQNALALGVEPRAMEGVPFLHVAARAGHSAMVRALGPYVDLEERDAHGTSALMVAAKNGHLHAMDTLRHLGARMNHTDREGRGLLHYAVWSGNCAVLDAALEGGAPLHARDINGHTALDEAISYGQQTMAVRLAKAGITLEAVDGRVETCPPLARAARAGLDQVVGALLKAGANVDGTDSQGMTALLLAAREGHEACVRQLLDAGANVAHVNAEGMNAEDLALASTHHPLATWLRRTRLLQMAQADKPAATRARM